LLGAVALMAGAILLLAVWIVQCAGHAARRRVLGRLDDRLLRDVELSRGRVVLEIAKPVRRA
jgi:hypothetical protein